MKKKINQMYIVVLKGKGISRDARASSYHVRSSQRESLIQKGLCPQGIEQLCKPMLAYLTIDPVYPSGTEGDCGRDTGYVEIIAIHYC